MLRNLQSSDQNSEVNWVLQSETMAVGRPWYFQISFAKVSAKSGVFFASSFSGINCAIFVKRPTVAQIWEQSFDKARTPILGNITTGGDITGGFCPGAGFPSCHKSIYKVSEDNFRGSACVSEWMSVSVKKRWGVGLS
jgi:hypothetical protein